MSNTRVASLPWAISSDWIEIFVVPVAHVGRGIIWNPTLQRSWLNFEHSTESLPVLASETLDTSGSLAVDRVS